MSNLNLFFLKRSGQSCHPALPEEGGQEGDEAQPPPDGGAVSGPRLQSGVRRHSSAPVVSMTTNSCYSALCVFKKKNGDFEYHVHSDLSYLARLGLAPIRLNNLAKCVSYAQTQQVECFIVSVKKNFTLRSNGIATVEYKEKHCNNVFKVAILPQV